MSNAIMGIVALDLEFQTGKHQITNIKSQTNSRFKNSKSETARLREDASVGFSSSFRYFIQITLSSWSFLVLNLNNW